MGKLDEDCDNPREGNAIIDDDIVNLLLCPVCFQLIKDCVECSNCHNIFCLDCVTKWMKTSEQKECPLCRRKTPEVVFTRNVPIQRIADTFKYDCPYCDLRIEWGERMAHFAECEIYQNEKDSLVDVKNLLLLRSDQLQSTIAWNARIIPATRNAFVSDILRLGIHPLFQERLSAYLCNYVFGRRYKFIFVCKVPLKATGYSVLLGKRRGSISYAFSLKLWCGLIRFMDGRIKYKKECLIDTTVANTYKVAEYECTIFKQLHEYCARSIELSKNLMKESLKKAEEADVT